jgi:hypothetical protein
MTYAVKLLGFCGENFRDLKWRGKTMFTTYLKIHIKNIIIITIYYINK